jgi:hypothetical protein
MDKLNEMYKLSKYEPIIQLHREHYFQRHRQDCCFEIWIRDGQRRTCLRLGVFNGYQLYRKLFICYCGLSKWFKPAQIIWIGGLKSVPIRTRQRFVHSKDDQIKHNRTTNIFNVDRNSRYTIKDNFWWVRPCSILNG